VFNHREMVMCYFGLNATKMLLPYPPMESLLIVRFCIQYNSQSLTLRQLLGTLINYSVTIINNYIK